MRTRPWITCSLRWHCRTRRACSRRICTLQWRPLRSRASVLQTTSQPAHPLDRRFATLCTPILISSNHSSSSSPCTLVLCQLSCGGSVFLFLCFILFTAVLGFFLTIHSPCFSYANDTDITHIAWFLAAFPLFSFNGSSIAPTTVNHSNRRSRFNLDVIPPITHQVIPLQHNRIALVIAVFFLSYSPQQQSLTFIIICHAHLFRSTSWSFPLPILLPSTINFQ